MVGPTQFHGQYYISTFSIFYCKKDMNTDHLHNLIYKFRQDTHSRSVLISANYCLHAQSHHTIRTQAAEKQFYLSALRTQQSQSRRKRSPTAIVPKWAGISDQCIGRMPCRPPPSEHLGQPRISRVEKGRADSRPP